MTVPATELHFSVTVDLTPMQESVTVTEHGNVVSSRRKRELLARAMGIVLDEPRPL